MIAAILFCIRYPGAQVKIYKFDDGIARVQPITHILADIVDNRARLVRGVEIYEGTVLDGGSPQILVRFLAMAEPRPSARS